ncbi:hypothetical protein NliqN6_1401 [Naganishia liquefaciens]|uniref:Uncharacterized protein n=1 Tax=Naganishia liquefaciens TaxID=104408 RepID=A0A8H3YD71_9TREE|nr:hypothetical protein NliqN6_1401 [Naganishia liquefaciens]
MRVLAYCLALVCLCPVGYATPLPGAFKGVSGQSHSSDVEADQVGHDLSVDDRATTEQVINETEQAMIDAMVSNSFATASDIDNSTIINIDPLSTGTTTVPNYSPFIGTLPAATDAMSPMLSSSLRSRRSRPRRLDAGNVNAYGVAETVADLLAGPYAGYTVGFQVKKLNDEWESALAEHEEQSDGGWERDASDAGTVHKQGDMSQDVGWCSRGFASRLRSKCATTQAEVETAKRIAVDAAAGQQAVEAELSACSATKDEIIHLNAELAMVMERDNAKAASERRAIEEKLSACSASNHEIIQLNTELTTEMERDKAKAASERQAVEEKLSACSASKHDIIQLNTDLTRVMERDKAKAASERRAVEEKLSACSRERKRSAGQLEYSTDQVAALSKQLIIDNDLAVTERKRLQDEIAFIKTIVKVLQVIIVFLLLLLFRLCCRWASGLGPELTGEEDDDDADEVEKGLFNRHQAPVTSHITTTRCASDNDHTSTSTTSDDAPAASSPTKLITVDNEANIAFTNTSQDRPDTVPSPYEAFEGSHSDLSEAVSPVPSAVLHAPAVESWGSALAIALVNAPARTPASAPATAPAKAPAKVPGSAATSAPTSTQTKAPAAVSDKAAAKAPGSVLGSIPGSAATSAPTSTHTKAPAAVSDKAAAKAPGSVLGSIPGSAAANAPISTQAKALAAVSKVSPAQILDEDQRPWETVLSKRDKAASKKKAAKETAQRVERERKRTNPTRRLPDEKAHLLIPPAIRMRAYDIQGNSRESSPKPVITPAAIANNAASAEKSTWKLSRIESEKRIWRLSSVKDIEQTQNRLLAAINDATASVISSAASRNVCAGFEKASKQHVRSAPRTVVSVWPKLAENDDKTLPDVSVESHNPEPLAKTPTPSRGDVSSKTHPVIDTATVDANVVKVMPAPSSPVMSEREAVVPSNGSPVAAGVQDRAMDAPLSPAPQAGQTLPNTTPLHDVNIAPELVVLPKSVVSQLSNSDAPSILDAPSAPHALSVPDAPCVDDASSVPDDPYIPDAPSDPDAPSGPDAPRSPGAVSVPNASVVPDTLSVPDVASVNDAPSGPDAPSVPDVASVNDAASGPDAPSTDVPSVPDAPTVPDASVPGTPSDSDATKVSDATIVPDNAEDPGTAAPPSSPPAPRVKTRGGKAEKKKKITYSGTAVRDVTDAAAWCLWRLARSSPGSYPELDQLQADASLNPTKIAGMALYQLLESAKPDKPEYVSSAVLETRLPSIVKSDSTLLAIKPKREDLPACTRFNANPFKARLPQAGRVRYPKLEEAGDLVLELGNQSRTVLQNAVVAPTSASKRASVAATRACDLLLLGLPRGKKLGNRVTELLQWMKNMPKESEL